jgi:hypothetical protein
MHHAYMQGRNQVHGWGDSFEILFKICKFINLSPHNKFFVPPKKFSLYFDPSFILKDKRISLYFDPFFIGVFLFQFDG